jgi:hypothetical protein
MYKASAHKDMCRIYVTSGGMGSSFLINALQKTGCQVHVRPDVAFATDQTLEDFPDIKNVAEFHKRSRYTLDTKNTINNNLVSYLHFISERNQITTLGRASRLGPFLTKNSIRNAVCLIRHPLHAYVSFVGHQHPEAGQSFGSFASENRIKWYAEQWNCMAFDYLSSGNKILRYEYMHDDVKEITNPNLPNLLKSWTVGKRNYGVLDQEKEDLLKELTSENFYKIYSDWHI